MAMLGMQILKLSRMVNLDSSRLSYEFVNYFFRISEPNDAPRLHLEVTHHRLKDATGRFVCSFIPRVSRFY